MEYTKWASSTLTSKVVGMSRLPNTTRPYIYNEKSYTLRTQTMILTKKNNIIIYR